MPNSHGRRVLANRFHSPFCWVGIDLVANQMEQWGWILLIVSMALYRYLIGLWPHSGEGVPPMHGDFEAQRHWMEITTSVPLKDWYRNTTQNDLLYWGLDYPPLTAYVSWICGKVGILLEPESMALETSRGYESETNRVFMRLTVIVCDLLIYFPACYSIVKYYYGHLPWPRRYEAVGLLMVQPALLIIDHGHFQYNGVCIGLTLLAVVAIGSRRPCLGAMLFACALNFKQIALYYALGFFFALLSIGIHTSKTTVGAILFVGALGASVIATFAIHWLPFCLHTNMDDTCLQGMSNVMSRVFPFNRGLFEDKVSNIWCVIDPVIKLRTMFGTGPVLKALSASATVLLSAPSCIALMRRTPSIRALLYALTSISLAFFLCAFQVHEKSILFPVASASIIVLEEPRVVAMFIATATFSMYPLLFRDGLVVPYVVTLLTFVGFAWNIAPVAPYEKRRGGRGTGHLISQGDGFKTASGALFDWYVVVSVICMVGLHALPLLVAPPAKYPDLFVLLLCAYCCVQFILAWAYSTWRLWLITGNTPVDKTKGSSGGSSSSGGSGSEEEMPKKYGVSDIPPFKKNQ
tara:strand:- start:97 stop:1830 length:1734 start_codon:yes stop_codon:yes gene_type:complete